MRVEPVSLDTPGVRWLLALYYARYGGHIEEVPASYFGAYDERGLAGVIAWIDLPAMRWIKEWSVVRGRRGKLASIALTRKMRERLSAGHVALANEEARAWARANGGIERAVFIELPAAEA